MAPDTGEILSGQAFEVTVLALETRVVAARDGETTLVPVRFRRFPGRVRVTAFTPGAHSESSVRRVDGSDVVVAMAVDTPGRGSAVTVAFVTLETIGLRVGSTQRPEVVVFEPCGKPGGLRVARVTSAVESGGHVIGVDLGALILVGMT